MMSEEEALGIFEQVGFSPPPGMSVQDAFSALLDTARRQQAEQEAARRPARGRTAVLPEPRTAAAACAVLAKLGVAVQPIVPCGCEVSGLDLCADEGQPVSPEVAGALEVLMAVHGFVLLRKQGRPQQESSSSSSSSGSQGGVRGTFLSGEQQCRLSESFGGGSLHSTHGVHPEAPCRDVFRLSNDPSHGFNSVGTEWHNDGSFCKEVFGHVVYHIVKAPSGSGDTCFAHLGVAFDKLDPLVQARLRRCASVNSNGVGAVHPLAAPHPLSGRTSLYLHLGMTGCMLERLLDHQTSTSSFGSTPDGTVDASAAAGGNAASSAAAGGSVATVTADGFGDGTTPPGLPRLRASPSSAQTTHGGLDENVVAWTDEHMDQFMSAFSSLLDDPEVSYSHKWEEGDVVIIDNLAIAHKAAPGAHTLDSGLRILHRTTILSGRPHDPPPGLKLPSELPTTSPCPFEPGATWAEGYVGFRWGAWEKRNTPH